MTKTRLVPGFTPAPVVKALINIGALMDIPTGAWITGIHGEKILNGGLACLTGLTGIGNNFKSTIMHYMLMSAISRIGISEHTNCSSYDTELNMHEQHIKDLSKNFEFFKDKDIFNDQYWVITDSTKYRANKWFEVLKEYLDQKRKEKDLVVNSPFMDRNGQLMPMIVPSFGEIDSFTEFQSDSEAKLLEENELGGAGANTYHMRAGLIKARFLSEAPPLTASSYHYLAMTAHLGKEGPSMQTGPMPAQPTKKLQFLKNGDKMKQVTDKFTFVTQNCWHCYNATPLINQNTKAAEYPVSGQESVSGDTDLMLVTLRQLRGKAGLTGYTLELVVSQRQGVLPTLSEFHFLRSNKYFGLVGSQINYHVALYPDAKLQRTNVRSKIETDPKLQRAINITSELLQMKLYQPNVLDVWCDPQTLYDDIKKLGYDWDTLLQTRGWWTINNDQIEPPFLSTLDLLNMRAGTYHPYWLSEDKKTIIKPKESKK